MYAPCLRCLLAVVLACATTSCGELPLRDTDKAVESELAPRLEQAVSGIEPGRSNRQSVRAMLGQPWITSDLFRFDAFRFDASVFDPRLLFVVVPVPMPLSASGAGYVLVTYEADGTVESVGQSIDPPHGDRYEAQQRVTVLAGSAGVSIVSMPIPSTRGDVVIEVDTKRRMQLETATAGGDCAMLMGCFDCRPMMLYIPTGLLLDGRPPMTGSQQSSPVRVGPGSHALSLPTKRGEVAGAAFECEAGQLLYATLYPRHVSRPWDTFGKQWDIVVWPAAGAAYDSEPLLIDDGGQWLVLLLHWTDPRYRHQQQ